MAFGLTTNDKRGLLRMKKSIVTLLVLLLLLPNNAVASDSASIEKLEKRIVLLEKELARIKKQEARASKYLQCIKKVEGNSITIPFKILNCIRK